MPPLTKTVCVLAAGLTLTGIALAEPPSAKPPPRPAPRGSLDPLRYRDLAQKALEGLRQRDIVKMLSAVAGGSRMGPGEGWFGPTQSRYGWKWLAARFDADRDGRITRKEFKGPAELFDRLDRDGDGVLTASDFDWSPKSPYVRMSGVLEGWLRRMNTASNGRLSREEWDDFFKKASRGKDYLTPADLRDALLKMPPRKPDAKPDKGPTPQILVAGLFKGELGSPLEGPGINDHAIRFSLLTPDGKRRISLGDSLGKKPIVLIFGSFT
jgi:hypothetical protein